MRASIVIPARFASTRLPGKPLLRLRGKSLIQWTWEAARRSRRASEVIVATDDPRIAEVVREFGGVAQLTGEAASGTDRVASVAAGLDADVVINLQGDHPFLSGTTIDALIAEFLEDPALNMATAASPLTSPEAYLSASVVKVVTSLRGDALYFSRAPIPAQRSPAPSIRGHIGIYAYRRAFLLCLAELPQTPLELTEQLEQLRVLEHGERIRVVACDDPLLGVDTPEDLARAELLLPQQEVP